MSRPNNFDALRLIAALTVLASHSIPLAYGPNTLDILHRLSNGQNVTFGQLGVQVFFVISGYLITGSYLKNPDPIRYLRARALRIVPALIPLFLILALIMGPIVTTLPLAPYILGLPASHFGLTDHLPGVFTTNPFSAGIDGSLWTLKYEAACYAAILVLGLARQLNRPTLTLIWLATLTLRLHYGPLKALDLGALFFAGATLRVWNPPYTLTFAAPAFILWGISLFFSGYTLISDTAGAYVILTLALAPGLKLPSLAKYGDLSYGVYIYAWPIQQTVVNLVGLGWRTNCLIATPLTLACAWASWHYIESPALRRKDQ